MKRLIKDIFFNLRMNFGIKIFSLKKSTGYYSKMKTALETLKNEGYCKLEKHYSESEVKELQNECLDILDRSEEIFSKNKTIKETLERVNGEIKIKHLHNVSNKLKVYSNEFFYTLISLFFCGRPKIPTVFFHLIHDGNFINKNVPGKSENRIGGQWHYDSMDHILKCFILLDDITPETGGETRIISGSRKKLKNVINDEDKKHGEYATNDEINKKEEKLKQLNILNDKSIKNLYGKKGDVFFIDTSNLHKGANLTKGIKRCIWLYF